MFIHRFCSFFIAVGLIEFYEFFILGISPVLDIYFANTFFQFVFWLFIFLMPFEHQKHSIDDDLRTFKLHSFDMARFIS